MCDWLYLLTCIKSQGCFLSLQSLSGTPVMPVTLRFKCLFNNKSVRFPNCLVERTSGLGEPRRPLYPAQHPMLALLALRPQQCPITLPHVCLARPAGLLTRPPASPAAPSICYSLSSRCKSNHIIFPPGVKIPKGSHSREPAAASL